MVLARQYLRMARDPPSLHFMLRDQSRHFMLRDQFMAQDLFSPRKLLLFLKTLSLNPLNLPLNLVPRLSICVKLIEL